jgi:hypothetical protein
MTIIKKRDNSLAQIETLANELADKPYDKNKLSEDKLVRTTISLPSSLLYKLEDMALKNKRENKNPRSVSAIIRYFIEDKF